MFVPSRRWVTWSEKTTLPSITLWFLVSDWGNDDEDVAGVSVRQKMFSAFL